MSQSTPRSATARPAGFFPGLGWRLEMWGWSIAYVFLAVPAIVLFCVLVTSLGVAVVTVGLVLLFIFVPLTGWFADLHRLIAGLGACRPFGPGARHSGIGRVFRGGGVPRQYREAFGCQERDGHIVAL